MDFLTFVVFAVLVFFLFKINARIDGLEEAINSKTKILAVAENITTGKSFLSEDEITHISEVLPMSPAATFEQESVFNFGDWLKEDWIMKLGAVLLLIGLGWFTTYAFMNNWIGPVGRIVLGMMAGTIFLIIGAWRIQKYQIQGDVFLVLGSTAILLTTFAARMYYDFFDPTIALLLMFLSVVFVAFVGVKYKSKYLPIVSLVLAGIAPLLTYSSTVDYIGLFSYLLIVVLGVIWVVAVTGQRGLTTASLLLVFFYSLPHFFSPNSELLLLAYLFTIIFFLSNIISILKSENKSIAFNMTTAGMTGIFLLSWVLSTEQAEFKSLIIAAWMLVFAVGAFLVFLKTKNKAPFYVYALASIAMLAAATALELKGEALLIAYTIESAIISLSIYLTMKDLEVAETFTFLLIGPIALSLVSIYNYSSQAEPITKDLFSLLMLTVVLFGTGLFFWNKAKEENKPNCTQINDVWVNAGSIYFYIILWIFFQKIFPGSDIAATMSLIIFTLIGLAVYFYGTWNTKQGFRLYGQILLGLIVLRLFVVDISHMEITGKIITFFLIGILLISTAFLGKKKPQINN
jgi:uncharacterized membrane protein